MSINKNTYLCFVGGLRQHLTFTIKSFSSFSHSGSSGMVFLCKTPTNKSRGEANTSKIYRSVVKQLDCVGLTKTPNNSKVTLFCYLRFYAAILGNVAKLTTLKKQTHKVLFTVPEMAINLQKELCQSVSFLLSFCSELIEKMSKNFCFLGSPPSSISS